MPTPLLVVWLYLVGLDPAQAGRYCRESNFMRTSIEKMKGGFVFKKNLESLKRVSIFGG